MSWNVLADAYVRADWFPLSDPELLTRGARCSLVLDLARSLRADVLCLQEADQDLAAAAKVSLAGYDVLWCPKDAGRPDGCLTAVRPPWKVTDEERLVYGDGPRPSGHVAHILELVGPASSQVTLANTHLRWAAPGTDSSEHVGVRQAEELVDRMAPADVSVVATDSNDLPGGPVRQALWAGGYDGCFTSSATSIVDGIEPCALDFIAGRGSILRPVPTGIEVAPPLPGPACPSDHVPVMAELS